VISQRYSILPPLLYITFLLTSIQECHCFREPIPCTFEGKKKIYRYLHKNRAFWN
jgi:hypothetical protein